MSFLGHIDSRSLNTISGQFSAQQAVPSVIAFTIFMPSITQATSTTSAMQLTWRPSACASSERHSPRLSPFACVHSKRLRMMQRGA